MSDANKELVRRINKGFEAGDNDAILACLGDSIRWTVAGHFVANGKDEFRGQITNDAADGPPVIELRNMVAEGEYVAVEGYVENKFKGGGLFKGVFHNTYRIRNGLIVDMTSYVVPLG